MWTTPPLPSKPGGTHDVVCEAGTAGDAVCITPMYDHRIFDVKQLKNARLVQVRAKNISKPKAGGLGGAPRLRGQQAGLALLHGVSRQQNIMTFS